MFHDHHQTGERLGGHGANRPSSIARPPRLIAKPSNASVQMGRCCQETGHKYAIAFA